MEHVAAMLLILGCPESSWDCQMVQDRLPQYETVASCETSIVDASMEYVGRHDRLLAQCVTVDPAHQDGWDLRWTVSERGEIRATTIPLIWNENIRTASL